jgi:hypothetical protein
MSKIHISEQKARKIIRSLIENHMDFDSEAVRRSSGSIRYLDDYFNNMVDEISYLYNYVVETTHDVQMMKNQIRDSRIKIRESVIKLRNMLVEIDKSDLDNERKESLKDAILFFLERWG